MSEEPKWFSGYIKTHDQDHQQLERKIEELEKRCDLFNRLDPESAKIEQELQKQIKELEEKLESYLDKVAMDYDRIKKLEQKLDSYIEEHHGFAEATIERNENTDKKVDTIEAVLLKHLQECGDPLWEKLDDEQELTYKENTHNYYLKKGKEIMEENKKGDDKQDEPFICDECGFVFKYGFLGPNKKTIYCPNCHRENDIERRKDPPTDDKTPDEIIIEQWKHLYKDYYNERLQNQRDEFLADLKKGWTYVIAKEKYWIARNKVSYQMIFQELLDVNRVIYGKWQKKKERD